MPNASMKTLIHLAENEVDQHSDSLQRLNNERTQASTQLSTLQQYRLDYSDRLLQASQSGVTMSNYHNFYRFIGTLDQAITQQNSLLELLEVKITQQQQQWLAAKQRLNAYQTLQERRDQQHAERLTRLEQRENDELSAAMYYRLRQFN